MSEWVTDGLLLAGGLLVALALGLFDWRLVVLWFGVIVWLAGVARLRRR